MGRWDVKDYRKEELRNRVMVFTYGEKKTARRQWLFLGVSRPRAT